MADRYTRRKLATDAPEGYQRSRAADREIYGTRSIDGSAPLSPRSALSGPTIDRPAEGGLSSEKTWRDFFPMPDSMASKSATPFMDAAAGYKDDPSKSFQMAGTPPVGGPVTAPMPTTPTAMEYFKEGIKGAGGLIDFGKSPTPSGFFTSTPYGPIGASNTPKDAGIADFFKRYRRA